MTGTRNRDNTKPEGIKLRKGQSLKVETRSLNLISIKSGKKNYKIIPKDNKNRFIAVFLMFKGGSM